MSEEIWISDSIVSFTRYPIEIDKSNTLINSIKISGEMPEKCVSRMMGIEELNWFRVFHRTLL